MLLLHEHLAVCRLFVYKLKGGPLGKLKLIAMIEMYK